LDGLDTTDVRIVAGFLIGGFFVFLAGAVRWKMAYQAALPESLAAIAASPAQWRWIHLWMIGGTIMTLLGLAGWTHLVLAEDGVVYSSFGLLLFLIGALPWLCGVVWRLTVLQAAALQIQTSGTMPPETKAWADWFGHLHSLHLLTAYLSWVALGASVLDTEILASWVGLLGIGLGLTGFVGYTALRGGPFAPPILAHLYPLFLGIALLVR